MMSSTPGFGVSTYTNQTLTLLLLLLGDEGMGSVSFIESIGEKNGCILAGDETDVQIDAL